MTRLIRAIGYLVFAVLLLGFMAAVIDHDVTRHQASWDKITAMGSPRPSGGD